MHKQDKYDALFSELKHEINFDQHKKSLTLHHLKTAIPTNRSKFKKRKTFMPIIISLTSIVVATCLVMLLLHDPETPTPIVANPPNEPSKIEIIDDPPLPESHLLFNVAIFGTEHPQLKNDIFTYLSTIPVENYESSDVFDTVKVDENGVAIVNFTRAFVDAYNNSMGTAGAGEFLRNINQYVFSYPEVQTVYYLLEGDATNWNSWLQFVDEPMTRAMYEEFKLNDYFYGLRINDSKETVILTIGSGKDYLEEKDVEIGGKGNFDRLIYESLDLTLLFTSDQLVSAFVEIHDTEAFDRFFESFTGNKLAHIVHDKQTSEKNIRILFSEESLNVVTAKYNSDETLTLELGTATPEEISNWKNGILE
jgi:hypothetical protein